MFGKQVSTGRVTHIRSTLGVRITLGITVTGFRIRSKSREGECLFHVSSVVSDNVGHFVADVIAVSKGHIELMDVLCSVGAWEAATGKHGMLKGPLVDVVGSHTHVAPHLSAGQSNTHWEPAGAPV